MARFARTGRLRFGGRLNLGDNLLTTHIEGRERHSSLLNSPMFRADELPAACFGFFIPREIGESPQVAGPSALIIVQSRVIMKFDSLRERYAKHLERWSQFPIIQQEMFKLLAVLLLVGTVALGFFLAGKPFWRHWKQQAAITQARSFAANNDYRNAVLALRRATEQNITDLETWKIVADFLTDIGSPEAITARRNAVNLSPDDNSLRLAYVIESLRFGEIQSAKEALAGVTEGASRDIAFHRMAAAVAMALRQTGALVGHLQRILQFDPANAEARFNLAALRVWGDDAKLVEPAIAELRALTAPGNPMRVRAALELLKLSARTLDKASIDALVVFLHQQFVGHALAPSQLADAGQQPPGWFALLEALKIDAAKNSFDAAQLGRWMASLGMQREALLWLEDLPPAMTRGPTVGSVMIDLIVTTNDMERLRKVLVDGGAFGRIEPAIVDLAYAARWQRSHRLEARGRTTFEDAISASAGSLNSLRALLRLADAWGDAEGGESVLRRVVQDYPGERWAYEALRLSYTRRRDTEKLFQLYSVWAPRAPENRPVQRTWIMLSLLLNKPGTEVYAAARREYAASPDDTATVLCRAAALRAQGQPADALAVLDAMPVAEWQRPKVALWRGVLLAETGQHDRARTALQIAMTGQGFLPEEQTLLQTAASKIGLRPSGGN